MLRPLRPEEGVQVPKKVVGVIALMFVMATALPAGAHQRSIESMDGGLDGNKLSIFVYLDKRHPGKMYVTLYKDSCGDWEFVDRKQAEKISPRGYNAKFPNQPGDESCKVRARFKADDHNIAPTSGELPC